MPKLLIQFKPQCQCSPLDICPTYFPVLFPSIYLPRNIMKHALINCKLPTREFEVARPNETKISDIARAAAYFMPFYAYHFLHEYFKTGQKKNTHPPTRSASKYPSLANFIHQRQSRLCFRFRSFSPLGRKSWKQPRVVRSKPSKR
jgi:hypothetical protein